MILTSCWASTVWSSDAALENSEEDKRGPRILWNSSGSELGSSASSRMIVSIIIVNAERYSTSPSEGQGKANKHMSSVLIVAVITQGQTATVGRYAHIDR